MGRVVCEIEGISGGGVYRLGSILGRIVCGVRSILVGRGGILVD